MGFSLSVSDGTTTISLTSGSAAVARYTPATPASEAAPLTESADVLCEGVSTTRTLVQSLNRLMEQARRYQQRKTGARVYLLFQPEGDADAWRSELLDGRVLWDEKAMDTGWASGLLEFRVTWERRPWWEGPETAIPLTNGNGSNVTSGLTLYNHDDADSGHDCWVSIAAASVTGDTPAPLKLELENTFNDTARAYRIYVGHNVWSNPGSFTPTFEGEDSTAGGTVTAEGTQSGGDYMLKGWSGTGETEAFNWSLSSAFLAACAGGYFRAVARFANAPSTSPDIWVRWKVKMAGLTTIWQGPWVQLSNQLVQSLDTLQLPPFLVGSATLADLTLILEARRDNAGSNSLSLDYVALMPLDGWRAYLPKGYGLQYTDKLVDDQIEGRLYGVWSSGEVGYWTVSGEPIRLWPGRDQRLYIVHGDWINGGSAQRTLKAKAWYRPRRLTL